jgi:hypothetical protein
MPPSRLLLLKSRKLGSSLLDQQVGPRVPGEFRGYQRSIRIQQREIMGKAEKLAQFACCRGAATTRVHRQVQQPGRQNLEVLVGPFSDDQWPKRLPAYAVGSRASVGKPAGRLRTASEELVAEVSGHRGPGIVHR